MAFFLVVNAPTGECMKWIMQCHYYKFNFTNSALRLAAGSRCSIWLEVNRKQRITTDIFMYVWPGPSPWTLPPHAIGWRDLSTCCQPGHQGLRSCTARMLACSSVRATLVDGSVTNMYQAGSNYPYFVKSEFFALSQLFVCHLFWILQRRGGAAIKFISPVVVLAGRL